MIILTPANSTIDLNKKILIDDKNKGKEKINEKELNISILGDKYTDTFTEDSNNNIYQGI